MSTLIITCIYSNLYGSEFGGRPSRDWHYKFSLLNILNLQPTKIICFTSSEELTELEKFFYEENKIDKNLLEFKIFDLKDTKYYDLIQSKKNIEKQKTDHRCFEIQYNKFFWISLIKDIEQYRYVYWFDAGLSHGGLFPAQYMYELETNEHGRNWYNSSMFTPEYLLYLNRLANTGKIILISKNNKSFGTEVTIPQDYYINFDNSRHIVGGFFGGITENYLSFLQKFDDILLKLLLAKENDLFMEESIMSCLYFNEKDLYHTLEFDDWQPWPHHVNQESIKYFYEIFLQK
jgi:hypothetical protein